MTLKERLAQSQAKMDEMKARVAKASEKAKNARQMRREEIEAEMAEIDRAIEELDHQIDAQIADDIATFEGDIAAKETNRAIARERRESKKNTALLKAQMSATPRRNALPPCSTMPTAARRPLSLMHWRLRPTSSLPPEKRLNISRNTVNNESTNGNE